MEGQYLTDVAESKLRHKVCVNAEDITRLRKERLAKIRSISLSLCLTCPQLPQNHENYPKLPLQMSINSAWSQEIKLFLMGLWCYFGLIRAQTRAHCLICDQVGAYPCRALPCPKLVKITLALWGLKGCVCSVGVANWVWGAKRSKESHRLGRQQQGSSHGTQKSPKEKLWLPKQGNLSQLLKSVSRQLEWRYHR